ncbi:RNA exonuclease 4 [Ornithorhynchus anatinus]|uniref:RNA exonuclease 4 n=1 Tax=Ornithorhynchus anatinus TaxID=9258 RepID=UPI0001555CFC|nr:RNA exonuclease 4 [Ornithorhynchus anatinus]XP_028919681.1 RNA exonuclease 4 [Ornithorhynchus anatinus]
MRFQTSEDRMAKGKAKSPKPPTGNSAPNPERLKKLNRKKKKKKIFWKTKAREGGEKQKGSHKVDVVRPPKAPQEFSHNWKALQELLKQKTPDRESGPTSRAGPRKPRKPSPRNGKPASSQRGIGSPRPADPADRTGGKSAKAAAPLEPPNDRTAALGKSPVGAAGNGKETKRRKNGSIHQEQRDIKHKKRKVETKAETPAPLSSADADIWFDDVDPEDIEAAVGPEAARIARQNLGLEEDQVPQVEKVLVKEQAFDGLTRAVAMDCEMVGVGAQGEESVLARVSIVNQFGKCVYDKFVKPTEKVTDYRTTVSGIRPEDVRNGEDYRVVQQEVANLLKGRILVGHALHNDLKILLLDHPKKKIRDTQKYKPFKKEVKSGRPSLKLLCEKLLGVKVQKAEHCSVQDAQAAMRLYTMVKRQWETAVQNRYKVGKRANGWKT